MCAVAQLRRSYRNRVCWKRRSIWSRRQYLSQGIFNAETLRKLFVNALVCESANASLTCEGGHKRSLYSSVNAVLEAGNLDKVKASFVSLSAFVNSSGNVDYGESDDTLESRQPGQIFRAWRHSMCYKREVFREVSLLTGNWRQEAYPTRNVDSMFMSSNIPNFGLIIGVRTAC